MIKSVTSIYTGDHGKGKLCFGSKLVVRTKQGDTRKKWSVIYPLADVKCKKDNGDIFKNTVKKNLAEGINKVEHGKIRFSKSNVNGESKWNCTIVSPDHADFQSEDKSVMDVVAFMIGDLKFLSMMLGKENFDGGHCYLCNLYIDEWQKVDHEPGQCWTLEKLKQQAAKFNTLTGRARMGVRESPYFDIPVSRYIWPILHTLIGVRNAILELLD